MKRTTWLIFGSETIEYRLPTHTRFGAIFGIKEYATPMPSALGQPSRKCARHFMPLPCAAV